MTEPSPPAPPPPSEPTNTPFWVAAAACAIPAFAGLYWSFSPEGHASDALTRLAVMVLCGVAYLSAAWLFVWPSRARAHAQPVIGLPEALAKVKDQVDNLDAIKKQHNRAQVAMDGVANQITQVLHTLKDEFDRRFAELDHRQKAFDQAVADKAKAESEASEARLERKAAVEFAKQWERAVIEFAQMLERTGDPESGVSEAYQQVSAKMVEKFVKNFRPFGLSLIAPAAGDEFLAREHEQVGREPHPTVPPGRVVRCTEWGVNLRGEVTKAKVIVATALVPAAPLADSLPVAAPLPPVVTGVPASTDPKTVPPDELDVIDVRNPPPPVAPPKSVPPRSKHK